MDRRQPGSQPASQPARRAVRQAVRQSGSHTARQPDRRADGQTDRPTDRQTDRQTDRRNDGLMDGWTGQASRLSDREAGRQAGWQVEFYPFGIQALLKLFQGFVKLNSRNSVVASKGGSGCLLLRAAPKIFDGFNISYLFNLFDFRIVSFRFNIFISGAKIYLQLEIGLLYEVLEKDACRWQTKYDVSKDVRK